MKASRLSISVCQNAVALALLFAAANATAITKVASNGTNAIPAQASARSATASPANTNLTPAATVSGPVASNPDDIRDIRQPRHFTTPWLWVVMAAGVALLAAGAYAAWQWLQHGKYFEMAPGEIALQRLEEARRLMDPDQAREYCFAVSKIIRSFVEDQWHLHAPRLTTEEFLRELVDGGETLAVPHRALLSDFLQHCDLAKFAGWHYSLPALVEMHTGAIQFVQQSVSHPASVPRRPTPPTPTPSATPAAVREKRPANQR